MLINICLVLFLQTVLSQDPAEAQYREIIKEKNRLLIDSHNEDSSRHYEMKLYDRFSGYTFEEIQHMLLNVEMKNGNHLMMAPKPESYSLMGRFKFGGDLMVNWT